MSQPNDPDLDAKLARFRETFDRQAKILGHEKRVGEQIEQLRAEFDRATTAEERDAVITRLRKLTLGEGEGVH